MKFNSRFQSKNVTRNNSFVYPDLPDDSTVLQQLQNSTNEQTNRNLLTDPEMMQNLMQMLIQTQN